uniref:palmitoyl-CoA hydrolase n=1 Tax=Crassostrea virginica TaxID=6565 RepID=A0A8B8D0H8_CRAVI|nr:lysosomal thioesterase PPT2-A-like [Crassostrea virginica]
MEGQLIFLFLLNVCTGYKAVVFIHGFNGDSKDGNFINDTIQKMHPNTPYYSLCVFTKTDTFKPLWREVEIIKPHLVQYMKAHPPGIHLICYSQGGLVCRGLLSTLQDHNVDTFIALSSPLAGLYGGKDVPQRLTRNIYRFFYSKIGQWISIGNYWKDPHHLTLYGEYSNYLAPLNNDSASPNIAEYKRNFLRLKKLVLIGGPDDDVISPWKSSLFGFYDKNENVQEMVNQRYYVEDSFGLRTLNEGKRLHTYSIPNISHRQWVRNLDVIKHSIIKWLT